MPFLITVCSYQLWVLAKEHLLERTTVLLSPPLDRDMVRMAAANISLRHSQATQVRG